MIVFFHPFAARKSYVRAQKGKRGVTNIVQISIFFPSTVEIMFLLCVSDFLPFLDG